ncbi:MAG: hypothetical protein ACREN2_12100 [Candidatus Dormibacteria bacterium]
MSAAATFISVIARNGCHAQGGAPDAFKVLAMMGPDDFFDLVSDACLRSGIVSSP